MGKLVSIIPRASIVVTKIEFHLLREVFQTRAPLEGLLGRLVATKMNNFYFSKLEQVKNDREDILKNKSRRTLLEDLYIVQRSSAQSGKK